MKAINPFSSMAAGANTFFAAIENDIQSGVKNADDEAQVGTTIEALAVGTTSEVLATDREALAGSAEANDAEPAVHELRERLAAAQQQCKKLEQRLAEKAELCGEKDSQLASVLEEGEQLSKRQAEQEKVIRELKQGLREAVAVGSTGGSGETAPEILLPDLSIGGVLGRHHGDRLHPPAPRRAP